MCIRDSSTDRAAWEVVEASDVDYTNKEITASFKDLSPVAVIAKVDTSADNAIGTSPQTGRFPVSVLWIGAAAVSYTHLEQSVSSKTEILSWES